MSCTLLVGVLVFPAVRAYRTARRGIVCKALRVLSPVLFLRREGYGDVPEVEFRVAQPDPVLGQYRRSQVEHQRHPCESHVSLKDLGQLMVRRRQGPGHGGIT